MVGTRGGPSRTRRLLTLRALSPVLVLSAWLLLGACYARADTTSCPSGQQAAVSFASTAALRIPIGGGAVIPPAVEATCAGVAVSEPEITLSLEASDAVPVFWGVRFLQALGPGKLVMTGNAHGSVAPPILNTGVQSGTFTLQASFAGATATLSGTVTGTLAGSLPPGNPEYALAVGQEQRPACSGPGDSSAGCLDESVAMINAGRMPEGIGPLELPSNWIGLTIPEQLFVMTDLERTSRGLAPYTGLAADFDGDAQAGADVAEDPTEGGETYSPLYAASPVVGESGSSGGGFASIEDPVEPNAIMATFAWVYTDGIFPNGTTGDGDCSASDPSHCWGHRDAILGDTPEFACELSCPSGAAFSATGYEHVAPSYTEIFSTFFGNDSDPLLFTWASEAGFLPTCERNGDSCSWSGQPLASASGFANLPGGSGGSVSRIVKITLGRVRLARASQITFSIRAGAGLKSVSATASGRHRGVVRLRVTRIRGGFALTGRLRRGRWIIRLKYRVSSGERAVGPSQVVITVA